MTTATVTPTAKRTVPILASFIVAMLQGFCGWTASPTPCCAKDGGPRP
jgi:hypothetical protein